MNYPLLTIFLLAHNDEGSIRKTLSSLSNQTYPNFKIVVSDNYSTDRTEEIVKSFQDPRISYKRNEKPSEADKDYIGCYYNYNSCLNSIESDFVSFCHGDDIYKKDMMKEQMEFLINNPDVGAVFVAGDEIDQNDNIVNKLKVKKATYNFPKLFKAILRKGNTFLWAPTFMARTDVFKSGIVFDEIKFRTSADLDMWFKIAKTYKVSILDKNLFQRRLGGGGKDYQHLCVERAAFFKVVDYYLESNKADKKSLRQYEYKKRFDDTLVAMNLLIKGKNPREILRRRLTFPLFIAFFENIDSKKIKAGLVRTALNIGITFGLSKLLGKLLYKLRYSGN